MADAQDCPKCGLVNPSDAQRCDCGWDFVSKRQETSYLVPKQRIATAVGIGGGLILALLAIRIFLGIIAAATSK
jgi:hypothetical protein